MKEEINQKRRLTFTLISLVVKLNRSLDLILKIKISKTLKNQQELDASVFEVVMKTVTLANYKCE